MPDADDHHAHGGGDHSSMENLGADAGAEAFAKALHASLSQLTESAALSASREPPLFFPGGIHHIELSMTLPSTFKLVVSGTAPKPAAAGEAGGTMADALGGTASGLPDYLAEAGPDTAPEDSTFGGATAIPVDTPLTLPAPGLYGTHTADRRYGTRRTIEALLEVGQAFHAAHGLRIGIGDISKNGGGPISGHASHRKGVDVDVRLIRNDGQEKGCRYQDAVYSRQLTQALVTAFRSNTKLPVTMIFFNDPNVSGVQPWPNHDNHLHVRFQVA